MTSITPSNNLTQIERDELAAHEAIIKRGLTTFVEVGNALMAIRDKRLYRETFLTFEEYCRVEWSLSQPRAYQMIDAAKVVDELKSSTIVELLPERESQARPLTKLEPDAQREVWQAVVESAPIVDGKPKITAAMVKAAVDEREILKAAKEIEREKREERQTIKASATAQIIAPKNNIDVYHGDMIDVCKLLRDIQLVIADPPYNVTKIEWDVIGTPAEFLDMTRQWLGAVIPTLADEYNLFWFCSPKFVADIELILRDEFSLPIKSRIIWHRRNMSMGSDAKNKFIDTWEMIYHVGNRPLNFSEDWSDDRFDVQVFAAPQTNFTDAKVHPTQKPLELIKRLVEFGSYPGDIVLDPFAGSGVTGAVSENRRCILIERDDNYSAMIAQRFGVQCLE